jgi:hypothetical protein
MILNRSGSTMFSDYKIFGSNHIARQSGGIG